ncbi:MAG: ATP-binding cassette domain-containing protein, partial [Micropepsaceae bacterium]
MADAVTNSPASNSAIVSVRDFHVRFATPDGEVHAVKDVSFDINEGECLGIVGESGSGKSQLFLAGVGLLAANGRTEGSFLYRGQNLTGMSQKQLNQIRGAKITMIFQDPLTYLNPTRTIGSQIAETFRPRPTRAERRARVAEALLDVGL